VNTYGNSARTVLNRIDENKEMNVDVLPFALSRRSVLNSLWSFIIRFHVTVYRDGIIHIHIPGNVLVPVD
jgi:hypothetical protein